MAFRNFVITGTGRSGTKFAARFFTRLGRPCGHQAIFTDRNYTGQPAWGIYDGDSSAFAAPHVLQIPEDVLIVHQTRAPSRVLAALLAHRHLPGMAKTKGVEFYTHYADVSNYADLPIRAAAFWIRWNELIERAAGKTNYMRVRVEDYPKAGMQIAERMGWFIPQFDFEAAFAAQGTTTGTSRVSQQLNGITIAQIDGPVGVRLREMAERYGYGR